MPRFCVRSFFLFALLAPLPASGQFAGDGREFLFPLIADGGGYRSRLFLYLTNLHEGANRCRLELRGPGLDGGMFDSHEAVTWTGAAAAIDLPDGRSHLALGSGPEHALSFGYAKLTCDGRVSARMLLSWSQGGATVSMTALENAAGGLALQLPVLPGLGRQGLLAVNDNVSAASCSIELTDDSGASVGGAQIRIPARAAVREFLEDLIPFNAEEFESGSATLACDREVSALGIPVNGAAFAAVPAVALGNAANAVSRHVLPLIADGGGFRSRLLVTNLADGANGCDMTLYGPGLSGDRFRPAGGVSLGGAGASWTLNGRGDQLSLPSVGGPELAFGYGVLDCGAAVAARGLLSVGPERDPAAMTVIPSSPPASRFRFHAAPRGGDMALVLNNDSAEADSCSVELNDYRDGNKGSREISVPPKSTAVRFYSDLFDFPEGVLTVRCGGDSRAISLPLSGGAFAALPPAVNASLTPDPHPDPASDPDPTTPPGPDSAPFLGYAPPFEKQYPLDEPMAALELPKAAGGNAPLTYSLEPSVPGLRFDAANSALTGTPTTEGNYAMTYQVTDADGDKDFFFFDIRVAAPDTAPRFAASDAPGDLTFDADSPMTLQLPAARGGNEPIVYSLSPRVPGLRFDAATRTLVGAPWRIGAYDMTYQAEDHESEIDTLGFTVTVAARISPGELLDAAGCADGTFIDGAAATPGLVGDCEALVGFANSLIRQGFLRKSNVLRTWGRGDARKLEEWEGVIVGSGRVVRLELYSRDLAGRIPAELGRLDGLRVLQLGDNRLTGPIPPEFGNLADLYLIYLADNQLDGTIPRELGKLGSLGQIVLSGNRLAGEIPEWLGQLAELDNLQLANNRFSGPIPSSLGQPRRMRNLNLRSNDLSGPIPAELRQLRELVELDLGGNRLTGDLPSWLGDLARLKSLDLASNELSGPIPKGLGRLGDLTWLNLSENDLTGPIPLELARLDELASLDLGLNFLTGPLPAEFAAMPGLRFIELIGNRLSGTLPWEYRERTDKDGIYLGIDGNRISGYGPPPPRQGNPSWSTDAAGNGNASHRSIAYFQGPLVMEWDWRGSRIERHTPILGRWAALAVSIDHAVETPPPVATRVLDAQDNVLAASLEEAGEAKTVETGAGQWRTEYVFHLPGALYQEGNRIVHVIDPDDELAETDETDNVSPPVVLHGEKPPKFRVTFVPIRYTDKETDWNEEDLDLLMRGTLALLPIADDYEARMGEPLDIQDDVRDGRGLTELTERWNLEADPDEFYHGVADEFSRGVAHLGGRTAVSAFSIHHTIPHEFGHNFSLSHTPGCGALGPDYEYPHAFGRMGSGRGWDLNFRRFASERRVSNWRDGVFVADIMSYCGEEQFISDYNYGILVEYWLSRRSETGASAVTTAAVTSSGEGAESESGSVDRSLALAGAIEADGGWTLTQAQYSAKAPRPPAESSDYTLLLFDSAGVRLYAEPLTILLPNEGGGAFWVARTPPPLRAVSEIAVLDTRGEEVWRNAVPALPPPGAARSSGAAAGAAAGAAPRDYLAGGPAGATTTAAVTAAAQLDAGDCSNGAFVDDPRANAALVGDCEALVAFANSLIGEGRLPAGNVLFEWGRGDQRKLRDWEGVRLYSGRVTDLDLYRKEIRGTLPPHLGELTALETLQLYWNEFSGPIPGEFARLRALRHLDLGFNELSGPIPRWIGQLRHLDFLRLSQNGFTGPIPREIVRLRGLRTLLLEQNRLTGEIPAVFGELPELDWLSLDFNRLSGLVPEELGKLSRLRALSLSYNQLYGSLPWELHRPFADGRLGSLRYSGNAIDGFAPPPERSGKNPSYSADASANGNASLRSIEYYQGPLILERDRRGGQVEHRTPILGRWAALTVSVDHGVEMPPKVITRVLDAQGRVLARSLAEAAPPTTQRAESGQWRSEYVFHLPGELFQDGNQVVHVIDPDNALAETDESDNIGEPVILRGETPPELLVTFVPVQFSDRDPWWQNVDTELLTSGISAYMPVADGIRARIGPVMKTEERFLGGAYRELVELWNFEAAPNEFYHGITDLTSGGLADTGFEVAISALSPLSVIPHEYGHNLGLSHPPGCAAGHLDFEYPWADGKLGPQRVWDSGRRRFVSGQTVNYADLMSYCGDYRAISTYSYDKAAQYWLSWEPDEGGASSSAAAAPAAGDEALGPARPGGRGYEAESRRLAAADSGSIALAGVVGADGVWTLTQARLSSQPPRPPRSNGEYTLLLFDSAGVRLYAEPLAAGELSEIDGLIWAARTPLPLRAAREVVILDAEGNEMLREALPELADD